MNMRTIPSAGAMTEFVNDPITGVHYTGTCGETAGLAAAHVVDPAHYPLNAAMLSTITRWEIGRKQASSNGSESIGAIASWLASVGLAHTNYGYSQPFTGCDWKALLQQWGGIKPIVFEFARAGLGLPGDETGVDYHFNACLGWDASANSGLFADGDNYRAKQQILAPYTLADLETAQVCGVLVLEYELGGSNMSGVPQGWTDSNNVLTAPNGKTVQHGFRSFILANTWDAADVPQSEEQATSPLLLEDARWGAGNLQFFTDSALMYAPNPQGVGSPNYIGKVPVGSELLLARTQLAAATVQINGLGAQLKQEADAAAAAQAQVTSLQSQLTAASGELSQADSDNAALKAQVASDAQQIAALQAQIQQLQQQQPPTPQPPATTYTPAQLVGMFISAVYAEVEADIKNGTPPAAQ